MPTQLIPARGLLLVRRVDAEDTFAGGRVLVPDSAKARLTAWQWDVVAVGLPAVCDARKCDRHHEVVKGVRVHPCDVRAGDWIMVRPRSDVEVDTLAGLCVVAQDDVWGVWRV